MPYERALPFFFEDPASPETLRAVRDLALAKARELAGAEAVHEAEVAEEVDMDDWPTYRFTLLVDPALIEQKPGLGRFMIQLSLDMGDEMATRRDPHRVRIRPLDSTDWPRRNDKGLMVAG